MRCNNLDGHRMIEQKFLAISSSQAIHRLGSLGTWQGLCKEDSCKEYKDEQKYHELLVFFKENQKT